MRLLVHSTSLLFFSFLCAGHANVDTFFFPLCSCPLLLFPSSICTHAQPRIPSTYWGENGYFRIVRGVNMMHIEEKCGFALLEARELDAHLQGKTGGTMFGLVDREKGEEPRLEPRGWKHMPHQNVPKKVHPISPRMNASWH